MLLLMMMIMREARVRMMITPDYECRLCLKRPKAVGCLSLVMTPDCINGACLFVLSSAAPDLALQANTHRVRETIAKDMAVRAMVAAMVTPLTPTRFLACFLSYIVLCPFRRDD